MRHGHGMRAHERHSHEMYAMGKHTNETHPMRHAYEIIKCRHTGDLGCANTRHASWYFVADSVANERTKGRRMGLSLKGLPCRSTIKSTEHTIGGGIELGTLLLRSSTVALTPSASTFSFVSRCIR
jgi:hypothetical protein